MFQYYSLNSKKGLVLSDINQVTKYLAFIEN